MPVGDFFTRIDRDPESFARLQRFADAFGPVESPMHVYHLAGPLMERLDHEEIWTLNLDIKGQFRGIHRAHVGAISEVQASMAHVFRAAVKDEATGCFLLHNHPSGDCWPSDADADLTLAARAAARTLAMRFYDHCVLGFREIFSFRAGMRWRTE